MTKHLLLIVAALLAGCEDDGGAKCSDAKSVTGSIVSVPTREPVTADLAVRGAISAPSNATVHAVAVNGVDATSASGDFRSWTATLPLSVLAAQAKKGQAMFTAVAFTNCGADSNDVGTQIVMVNDMPGILVTSLKLAAAIPNGQTYLPATKPVSALVTVDGNAQAAGGTAALATTSGTLASDHVTLSGDGTSDALGQVLFSSMTAGTAVITATAMGQNANTAVTVIGPPTFAPDGTDIHAGGSLRVTVVTTGKVDSCQATPAARLHVTSGPADLMQGTGGIDQTMDGLIDIDITVDAGITDPVTTTLSCRDPFGQVATAMFTGRP